MGAVFLGLCFPLANHLASLNTSDLTQGPFRHAHTSFSQAGFQRGGLWEIDRTYYELVSPPFLTSKDAFCTCVVGEVSVTSRMEDVFILSFYSSRAQLLYAPAINFVLEVLGEINSNLLRLTNSSCSAQGPIYFLPQLHCLLLGDFKQIIKSL